MEILSTYLPLDRRLALSEGRVFPDRTAGAALFADISGFTPLTEALARVLGPRRGAEELMVHLNAVYDALIGEVDRHGGSVIAFAGDAITCWFDGDDGRRATAAGLAMQEAMRPFASVALPGSGMVGLAVKVAVAVGPARRFAVGDPALQRLDVLAGRTLVRMAAGGQLAQRGEVVVDATAAGCLPAGATAVEWRAHPKVDQGFALVEAQERVHRSGELPGVLALPDELVRPWLIPAVYERLRLGLGEFLTELRPAVALFLKFDGIDYDDDAEAGTKLDTFVVWVQRQLARYEGFLIDVNIGDKGSSIYSVFGAPVAHEDDTRRALALALALREAPSALGFVSEVRIGLSRGTMRTGACGGTTRRTYGVLGDEVNLAARLMERAAPGQILVSGRVQTAFETEFQWQALPELPLKGKSKTVPVFALLQPSAGPRGRTGDGAYALPMVGRREELAAVGAGLSRALAGHGQVMGLVAEAGMGKSRLIAEVKRVARERGFDVLAGQCQSYGAQTSYLPWWEIWNAFFGLDPDRPIAGRVEALRHHLEEVNPALVARLPVLGDLLNLPIPDNEVTKHFEAKLRKASLEGLLVDCLRHRAGRTPLLIVLEDTLWMDPLSRDLLEVLSRTIEQLPVLILQAYRPVSPQDPVDPRLPNLAHFVEVPLGNLPAADAEQLLRLKMAQRHGPMVATPPQLVELLLRRSEGNPFYLEELINFLHDQGVNPADPAALASLELPASLHSLVLGRIDRLVESQRVTLKVASVIGRLFPAAALWGVQTGLHEPQVLSDLAALQRLDLTALDRPEPELLYVFKHVVTQEVAYESLPFATRATLHNEIGLFLERQEESAVGRQVDLLAYHFDRSENTPKRRHYLLRAGEAAQTRYANAAALDYYRRALPLLEEAERLPVLLRLGRVLEMGGAWDEADGHYHTAGEEAAKRGDTLTQARAATARGDLRRKRRDYPGALQELEQARGLFESCKDEEGIAETLRCAGTVAAQQGDYPTASARYKESLAIRRRLNDKLRIANLLNNLGIIAWYQGEFYDARAFHEASLSLAREMGDRWAVANSLNNLGLVLRDLGETDEARASLAQSLALNREVGDRWAVANGLSGLGDVALSQRDLPAAEAFLRESLQINQELGDRGAIAFVFEFFAILAAARSRPVLALQLVGAARALRETLGAPLSPSEKARLDTEVTASCRSLAPEDQARAMETGRSLSLPAAVDLALSLDGDAP